MGFGDPGVKEKSCHPIIHSLIEVYVVEKSIVDKHGDATARHRTDIETEWRHRTFPRRFAPLLCSRFLDEEPIYTAFRFNEDLQGIWC